MPHDIRRLVNDTPIRSIARNPKLVRGIEIRRCRTRVVQRIESGGTHNTTSSSRKQGSEQDSSSSGEHHRGRRVREGCVYRDSRGPQSASFITTNAFIYPGSPTSDENQNLSLISWRAYTDPERREEREQLHTQIGHQRTKEREEENTFVGGPLTGHWRGPPRGTSWPLVRV